MLYYLALTRHRAANNENLKPKAPTGRKESKTMSIKIDRTKATKETKAAAPREDPRNAYADRVGEAYLELDGIKPFLADVFCFSVPFERLDPDEMQEIADHVEKIYDALHAALAYAAEVGINPLERALIETSIAVAEEFNCIDNRKTCLRGFFKPLDAALSALAATLPAA